MEMGNHQPLGGGAREMDMKVSLIGPCARLLLMTAVSCLGSIKLRIWLNLILILRRCKSAVSLYLDCLTHATKGCGLNTRRTRKDSIETSGQSRVICHVIGLNLHYRLILGQPETRQAAIDFFRQHQQ